jgi:hypothetical protein
MPLPSLPDALEAAMQAPQAITMSVDPGKVIIASAVALAGAVFAGLKLLGTRVLAAVDAVGQKVDDTAKQVSKIDQELFGPTGENGMRSDVKRMSRVLDQHDAVLIQLAVKNDIDVPERIP